MKYKVIRPCIDQDSKKKLQPGDTVHDLSDFEVGRHLAEGNIVPDIGPDIERSVKKPPEKRAPKRRAAKTAE